MVYQQVGTSIETKVLHVVYSMSICGYCVSYHTICHLQPSPTKTSTLLQMEPGLGSQMLGHLEACQVTYL